MKKKMELEGKTGEVESIIEEQGKVRLRMDCGRRVLVSLDRVRVQEVEHMGGAEDSKAAQQQQHGEETKGRGVAVDNEPHGRKEERSEEGEMGGQEETFELWNEVRSVGMRQPELEGHKGVLEEIYKDKVQVLLVGGMRRVKVDKKKVAPEVVEPIEVLPPGFEGWSFLEQIGVGSAPTMDEVKAAYRKWVLPEVRRWEPEVFIISEGINFTVEDTTGLMRNLHRANVIAEQVGIRLYKEQKLEAMGEVDKPHPRVTRGRGSARSHSSDGVKVTGCSLFSAVPSTKARPGTHHGMA